jgi:hypothetical protein
LEKAHIYQVNDAAIDFQITGNPIGDHVFVIVFIAVMSIFNKRPDRVLPHAARRVLFFRFSRMAW